MITKKINKTCPLCGTQFPFETAESGTSHGHRLDMKKIGPIAQPWPLAKCPDDGFVCFQESYSDDEIEVLKPHVSSDEYQSTQHLETDYYLAYLLVQKLGASDWRLIWLLLSATWEAETKDHALYERYVRGLITRLMPFTQSAEPLSTHWLNGALLLTNACRRLGDFDQAKRLALALEHECAKSDDEEPQFYYEISQRLISLINDHISDPRAILAENDIYLTP